MSMGKNKSVLVTCEKLSAEMFPEVDLTLVNNLINLGAEIRISSYNLTQLHF